MLSPLEETLVLKENKTSTTSALAPKVIISGVLCGFFREFFRGSLETLWLTLG